MMHDRRQNKRQGEGDIVALWEAREAICDRLEITPRTLQRRVKAGLVMRRQDGRRALYRQATGDTRTDKHDRRHTTEDTRQATPVENSDPLEGLTIDVELDALVRSLEAENAKLRLELERATSQLEGVLLLAERLTLG